MLVGGAETAWLYKYLSIIGVHSSDIKSTNTVADLWLQQDDQKHATPPPPTPKDLHPPNP